MRWVLKQTVNAPPYYYDNVNPQCAITPLGNKFVAYTYGEYDSGYENIMTFTHNGTEWSYINTFAPTVVNKKLCSMAISNNGLVLYFCPGGASSVGIQVFDWIGGVWVRRVSNICIPSDTCTVYGHAMALNPDNTVMVVVGGTLQSGSSFYNYVYTFDWNGSSWIYRNRVQSYNINYLTNGFICKVTFFSDSQKIVLLNPVETVLAKGAVRTYQNSGGNWSEVPLSVITTTTGGFRRGCLSMTYSNRLYTMDVNYHLLPIVMYDWDESTNKFVSVTMPLPSRNTDVSGVACCSITDGRLVVIGYRNTDGFGFLYSYESFDNMLRGVIKYNERLSDRIHDIEVYEVGSETLLTSGKSKSDGTFLIDVPIPNVDYPVNVKVYDNNLIYGETLDE